MLRVPDKIDFSEEEEKIQKVWKETETFRNSLKQSITNKKFTFFDGPPFATGLPHYGHVLAGTVKDIVTRFAHQSGNYVGRRFGWDCHGLPVEYEIDKLLKITGPQDVAKMGIDNYNAECRKIVMRYSHEWEVIMGRLARWIDFEDDYKTLYPWYMESIWFIFRELYTKGLVYKGVKVMPYSTACNTPLSNFESGQNYKEVVDPQVTIGFPLLDDPSVQLVAWTTTPWTLPSNMTLCVNPDMTYVKVKSLKNNEVYILMEARLMMLFKNPQQYEILEKFPGKTLGGRKYEPLFPYFAHLRAKGAFQVLVDKYVSDDAGTGIVHQAPYFGEDDYRVCLAAGVITRDQEIVCPVDASGKFVEPVKDFLGQHVKVADKAIIQYFKQNCPKRLLDASTVKHSYPFCWRSDTPLIYRAIPSWFVRVEPMIDSLIAASQSTYWVPDFVKEKRFGNWLSGARDWAISRNRYWGTPIPIWISEDGKEIVCVGSIAELEQLTGVKVSDLHRETVDNLTIPSVRPGMPPLKRVSEVFDCWFESGSMPYAQLHFPFSRDIEINFHDGFPADFIAEGIDQTRGWFYTLLVVSTGLFNKAPFKNLIAHGLVLASDGQKMSKSKKNYPDPLEVVKRYGADSLRLYLINSPVVRAENLRFKEEGVRDVLKDVLLPWYNAYRYLAQSIERLLAEENITLRIGEGDAPVTNTMDKWIKSATQTLVTTVWKEMKLFHLYKVVPLLVDYIDQLTNWYIRMNRRRLKGDTGVEDCVAALKTLFEVLDTFVRIMAPFTPFTSELMYQNLRRQQSEPTESVHFLELPQPVSGDINLVIERRVKAMQFVISTGRVMRDKRTVPVKYPLPELVVIHKDAEFLEDLKAVESYILEELNVKRIVFTTDCDKHHVTLGAQVDHKMLGARLKGDFKSVLQAVQNLKDHEVQSFLKNGGMEILKHKLTLEDVFISYRFDESKVNKDRYEVQGSQEVALVLDMERSSAMMDEGLAREVVNLVQKLRKKGQLVPTDPVTVYYNVKPPDSELAAIVSCHDNYIETSLRAPFRTASSRPTNAETLVFENCELKGSSSTIDLDIVKGYVSDWAGARNQTEPAKAPSNLSKDGQKVVATPKDHKDRANINEKKQAKEDNKKINPKSDEKVTTKTGKNVAKDEIKTSAPLNNSKFTMCNLPPTLTPCVSYVIVQPGQSASKDPFAGLIVPLENPLGRNRLTGSALKQQVISHFSSPADIKLITPNGQELAQGPLDLTLNGQILIATSANKNLVEPSSLLPNQPFLNVTRKNEKGVIFLSSPDGKDLSAKAVTEDIKKLFGIQGNVILTNVGDSVNSLNVESK